jgi:hypothetical protein
MVSQLRFLLTLFTILCFTTIASASVQKAHAGYVFEKTWIFKGVSHFPVKFLAANGGVRTNFSVYETIAEVPISGATRGAHRASANTAFARQLEGSSELQSGFNQLFGQDVLQHMNSGAGRALVNPPGAVWHHPVGNPGVLQLLKTGEHTNPLLGPILHPLPNRTGGFGAHFGGN